MIGAVMAGVGLASVLGGAAVYLVRVARGDLRPAPGITRAGVLGGGALSLGGLLLGGGSGAAALLGGAGVLGALAALWLHSQRHVPQDTLRVAVGSPVLPFRALTAAGEPWDSRALAGRRVLLKFYRGEWCPFCQAELRRFEAMRPQLQAAGIEIVALSCDPPAAAQAHQRRDGLGFQLLCDPELAVIRQYGVEHRKALQISGARVNLLGLSVGTRPARTTMAAPTTLLIDEHGIVRWIDQTDDYKVRSSAERVVAAVTRTLGVALDTPRSDSEPVCAAC